MPNRHKFSDHKIRVYKIYKLSLIVGYQFYYAASRQRHCTFINSIPGKKLSDGRVINGKGRLTNNRIDVFQNIYGHVIRSNKGNPEAMSKGVLASLKHYCSTIEKPQHEDCPIGTNSWCSYQRDKATNQSLHRPVRDPTSQGIHDGIRQCRRNCRRSLVYRRQKNCRSKTI